MADPRPAATTAPPDGKLRLRAHDADDLQVLSACLQDAIVPISDVTYEPAARRFVLVANRFCWERADGARDAFDRVNCGVVVEGVSAVKLRRIDRNDRELKAAINLARKNSNVIGIVIGNETIFRAERIPIENLWVLPLPDPSDAERVRQEQREQMDSAEVEREVARQQLVVSPGRKDIIERRGNLAVAELRPRRHGAGIAAAFGVDRPFEPEQNQAHQIAAAALLREQFGDVAGKRGKCSGNSLPVLLMAYAAIGAEDARTELLPLESGRRRRLRPCTLARRSRKEGDRDESESDRRCEPPGELPWGHR